MQTTFAFTIDAPADADLHGSQILIPASDAAEADRLAAIRTRLYGAPLRRCGVIAVQRAAVAS